MFTQQVDENIELALVQPSFAALYVDLAKDNYDYLEQWLAWPPHNKVEADFKGFVEQCLTEYATEKSMVCGVFYQGDLVGTAGFNSINHDLKKAELGYWLGASMQGHGIITKVNKHLINIAFNELGMDKVQLCAAEHNLPSRAVAQRLGMTLEGIITNAENLNGRIVDHAIYGLLKEQR